MKADRFFSIVKRTNALIFLIGGLVVTIFLLTMAWDSVARIFRSRPGPAVVRVAEQGTEKADWYFGPFERLSGTDVVWAALRTKEEYAPKFSSGSSSDTKNFLFYNFRTQSSSWLIRGNANHIAWHEVVTVETPNDKRTMTAAILFHVALSDSTADGIVNSLDKHGLAICAPDGSGFSVLLDEVDSLRNFHLYGADHGFLFYVTANALRVAEIDLKNRQLVHDSLLPISTGIS